MSSSKAKDLTIPNDDDSCLATMANDLPEFPQGKVVTFRRPYGARLGLEKEIAACLFCSRMSALELDEWLASWPGFTRGVVVGSAIDSTVDGGMAVYIDPLFEDGTSMYDFDRSGKCFWFKPGDFVREVKHKTPRKARR